ncbi:helix-turn-helix domain-containing protein [Winogradskyella aquimaris]|uniref:Helix-turn-helix domain-containing protein n=1 Tax=Winogradskyella aquimaris TaxID=864074 RepID=A0ABU5EPQ0_9FLAO|nr:helix-turn-helix domain-containing protein [Winogradskyella aquimaris]MDY2588327.1 helix-turn-helix domain-containing protein [Winogradskyella aquimaris]
MVTSNTILFTIICVCGLQAMILSGLVAFKKPRTLANIFLALLVFFYALIAINIVVVNVMKDYDMLHVFRYMQLELLYGIGPALYFYTKCITHPQFQFRKKDFIHFIPLLLEFIFYRTSIYRTGSDGLYLDVMPTNSYIYLTQQWIGVLSIWTYSIASLILLKKYQKQIKEYYSKIEHLSLKWLQTPILIYISYHFLWRIVTEIDRFIFDKSLREYYFLPNFTILAIITCWIGFKGYLKKTQDVVNLKPFEKKSKNSNATKDQNFLSKFKHLMETRKPYLNPDLNLAMLADLLEMKPRLLSSKINDNLNQNFYDIVNTYRVEAFKERLISHDRDQLSLLGHALECGFSSKSTFNNAFKKITQKTPSEYLRTLKKTS